MWICWAVVPGHEGPLAALMLESLFEAVDQRYGTMRQTTTARMPGVASWPRIGGNWHAGMVLPG